MDVKLYVFTQAGEQTEIEAPLEMIVEEFLTELVQALDIPNRDAEGNPVEWRLDNKDTGRTLDSQKSLLDNGVCEGHRLSLIREVFAGGGEVIHGITQVLTLVVSSGVAAGAYNLLKTWIDTKNGRKLKLKVGENRG